jgi:hypothetical protein
MARRVPRLVVATWLLLCSAGYGLLMVHGVTPGAVGPTLETLPASLGEQLQATAGSPLVLLCAHPQCPCLPSTLGELRAALTSRPDAQVRLLVYTPTTPTANWSQATTAALREGLPHAQVVEDPDGAMAWALGARTSGHVFVYDHHRLRFSGGVTGGRAHHGDNAGRRSLARVLENPDAESATPAVFGCPLRADEAAEDEPASCCSDRSSRD